MHSYGKKKFFFPHVRNFTLIYGPYSCLIDNLLALFWWKIMFFFSNSCLIFMLMLCNLNLTKLDIITLLSSDCRAWAPKLSEHLKKRTNHVLVFICQFKIIFFFLHFLLTFFFISYIFTKLILRLLFFIY